MKKNQLEFPLKQCEDLIKKWESTSLGTKKNEIQNELYSILNPFMDIWIFSILSSRKSEHIPLEEITSKKWDCFKYCLNHYKPESKIPIPNHFYSYTKFHLSMLQIQDKKGFHKGSQEELINLPSESDDLQKVYEHLEELKKFRDMLPKEYISVFDDAIMSMIPRYSKRIQRLDDTSLYYAKYQIIKKVIKIIIRFLLLR
jgi:hypothetical protein